MGQEQNIVVFLSCCPKTLRLQSSPLVWNCRSPILAGFHEFVYRIFDCLVILASFQYISRYLCCMCNIMRAVLAKPRGYWKKSTEQSKILYTNSRFLDKSNLQCVADEQSPVPPHTCLAEMTSPPQDIPPVERSKAHPFLLSSHSSRRCKHPLAPLRTTTGWRGANC